MKNISSILFNSDLVIAAGGIILYEAACVGVPTIAICHDKNQLETAMQFQKEGACVNLGLFKKFKIKELILNIETLSRDSKTLEKMGQKGKKLIDCRGVYRVANIIKEFTKKDNGNE